MKESEEFGTPVCYVAHPFAADPTGNLASVKSLLLALARHCPEWAFALPWVAYVQSLTEEEFRVRGMRDNLVWVERSDAIALFNPKGEGHSSGMKIEFDHAHKQSISGADFSHVSLVEVQHDFPGKAFDDKNDHAFSDAAAIIANGGRKVDWNAFVVHIVAPRMRSLYNGWVVTMKEMAML